jgi:hypothetical protein
MSKIPEWKRQKVAKFGFGTDEVVVAKISKRVGVMPLRAKDFT